MVLASPHCFSLALTGSDWCSLVLTGPDWCSLVFTDPDWCLLVFTGLHQYLLVCQQAHQKYQCYNIRHPTPPQAHLPPWWLDDLSVGPSIRPLVPKHMCCVAVQPSERMSSLFTLQPGARRGFFLLRNTNSCLTPRPPPPTTADTTTHTPPPPPRL